MKTIIISDIKGSTHSVIPYGLNLARSMDSEVTLIHIVDPRVNQAKYSSYSDSQSLSPGEPMGHEETSVKEVSAVETEIDNFISREASRVNYPLKVDTVVKAGNLEDEIEKMINEETSCIVVASSEPDGTIFQSKGEIYDLIKDSGAMCILVPPGKEFREYKKFCIRLISIQRNSINIPT
jgi:nucleotide-binding universal stress UspA family protein